MSSFDRKLLTMEFLLVRFDLKKNRCKGTVKVKSIFRLLQLIPVLMIFICSNIIFAQTEQTKDTIRIANEEVEYEIIIIEVGFDSWLLTNAKPRFFYSEQYLEAKNRIYVSNWNQRVLSQYNTNLYTFRIDYEFGVDYGYEVNYLLYNYFLFFEQKYAQRLGI